MKSEKEKMLAGEMYSPEDLELVRDRQHARNLVRTFNQTADEEGEKRLQLLKELLGSTGDIVKMEPNIRFDYGYNTHVGENFSLTSIVRF